MNGRKHQNTSHHHDDRHYPLQACDRIHVAQANGGECCGSKVGYLGGYLKEIVAMHETVNLDK